MSVNCKVWGNESNFYRPSPPVTLHLCISVCKSLFVQADMNEHEETYKRKLHDSRLHVYTVLWKQSRQHVSTASKKTLCLCFAYTKKGNDLHTENHKLAELSFMRFSIKPSSIRCEYTTAADYILHFAGLLWYSKHRLRKSLPFAAYLFVRTSHQMNLLGSYIPEKSWINPLLGSIQIHGYYILTNQKDWTVLNTRLFGPTE